MQLKRFLDGLARVLPLHDNDGGQQQHVALPADTRPSTWRQRRQFAPPSPGISCYPSASQRSLPAQRDGTRILAAITAGNETHNAR